MEWTSPSTSLLKSLKHITSCMDISCKSNISSNHVYWIFKVIHKWEWYVLHIILNLHRGGGGGGKRRRTEKEEEGGGGGGGGGGGCGRGVGIQKQWKQKWKWNTLQTKPEHVTIIKQQCTWSTWTKAQHPRKIGWFIRKCHKLLQHLF